MWVFETKWDSAVCREKTRRPKEELRGKLWQQLLMIKTGQSAVYFTVTAVLVEDENEEFQVTRVKIKIISVLWANCTEQTFSRENDNERIAILQSSFSFTCEA